MRSGDMKKQVVLNEDDIRQTIANSFNVDKAKVNIERRYEEDTVEFGVAEKVYVIVEVPMNDQR